MFEKEAEENKPPYAYCSLNTNCELWKDGFQKGAELSYNKAKKDADKMKSRFLELCNLKDMRIAELENANKWHYVKDGDLPRQDGNTCFSIKVLANNKKWVYYQFSNGMWFCGNKAVIVLAWKEIVFPEFQ